MLGAEKTDFNPKVLEPYTWGGQVYAVPMIIDPILLFYMILFLAGIQQIPAELYEAARVDGAESGLRLFRHITWPMLRNTSVAVTPLLIINAFQAFDEFYNILASNLSRQGLGDRGTPQRGVSPCPVPES